jgi:hypothetical protein
MKTSGTINEEYLFEIFDIIKDYVPVKDREAMAEHLYDYLNGINAPQAIFDGLAECDETFDEIYSKNLSADDNYDESEDYDRDDDYSYDED